MRTLPEALRRAWRGAARSWRRSLRLRVVATTVALSLAVVALIGTFLVDRVRSGLLNAKEDAGLAQAAAGARFAQQQFDAAEPTGEVGRDQLAVDVVRRLATSGGPGGRSDILLIGTPTAAGSLGRVDFSSSTTADAGTVPEDLRRAVRAGPGQAYRYVALPDDRGGTVPGLAIGSAVRIPGSGDYELYYLFPLEEEQATLALVQRALAVAGIALVALVGLIALLVTRQVVTPVRMAASIAERLSAGRLEERMHVRGEDDLARLAASFNKMAAGLQRQIRQLEDLSRVQRRFVSDVSHELRTPLTTVRMAADLLHESRAGFAPAVARSAELLQAQLDRFESLLADLLEISRFDAGAASLEAEPADLRHLAARVIEAAEPLAARRGSVVTLDAPASPCVAVVDARRIDRVLRNLLGNAIEHGEGHPIVVRVAQDDHAVAVAVRDHGVGLKPGEASLVFNRFWRADPARARTTGGTGLGLAIAFEDAQLHGGWLQAWGEPGRGAQFRLTLPRRAGHEMAVSPLPLEPRDAHPPALTRRTVPAGAPYRTTSTPAPSTTGSSGG
jgi:two-component system, OmpR family, sensor histidine kinase MtrB